MSKPKVLDLFSGSGGAALGLKRAGFHVTGIDIKKPTTYLGDAFIQADVNHLPVNVFDFDVVWASPPCQAFSLATGLWKYIKDYPNLIPLTRQLIAGHPYSVIENVPPAPIRADLKLWGPCVGLGATDEKDGLWRCRHFELSFFAWQPTRPKLVKGQTLCITKRLSASCHYYRRKAKGLPGKVSNSEARAVMGYPDWVNITDTEIAESVPPPYAKYIGLQILARMQEDGYIPIAERRNRLRWRLCHRRAALLDAPPF